MSEQTKEQAIGYMALTLFDLGYTRHFIMHFVHSANRCLDANPIQTH